MPYNGNMSKYLSHLSVKMPSNPKFYLIFRFVNSIVLNYQLNMGLIDFSHNLD